MFTRQNDGAEAPGPVTPTPEKNDAQEPGSDVGTFGDETTGNDLHSAELAQERKRLVTLQALLALRRIELQVLASGALQIVAPGMLVRCSDLGAAEAWCRGREER